MLIYCLHAMLCSVSHGRHAVHMGQLAFQLTLNVILRPVKTTKINVFKKMMLITFINKMLTVLHRRISSFFLFNSFLKKVNSQNILTWVL